MQKHNFIGIHFYSKNVLFNESRIYMIDSDQRLLLNSASTDVIISNHGRSQIYGRFIGKG